MLIYSSDSIETSIILMHYLWLFIVMKYSMRYHYFIIRPDWPEIILR